MTKKNTASKIYGVLTIVFLSMVVLGVFFAKDVPPEKDFSEMVAVSVVGYNHIEDKSIIEYSVNDGGGAPIPPFHGGGSFTCCVKIPLYWRPNLKAKVSWRYGGDPQGKWSQVVTVEIPEYTPENMGSLQVHFYSNNRVIVISTQYELGHPWNPLPEEDRAPWSIDEAVVRNLEWFLEQQKQSGKAGEK